MESLAGMLFAVSQDSSLNLVNEFVNWPVVASGKEYE
jgi:hypothetical protein